VRADHTRELAAERQQPLTAAEQAAADGRPGEWARDVPRTCVCPWRFSSRNRRYTIISQIDDCPWHGQGETESPR
jgi:hypothetical protein